MIPAKALAELIRYPWPGNIRELQNVIERAIILAHDDILRPSLPERALSSPSSLPCHTMLESIRREYILQVFRRRAG